MKTTDDKNRERVSNKHGYKGLVIAAAGIAAVIAVSVAAVLHMRSSDIYAADKEEVEVSGQPAAAGDDKGESTPVYHELKSLDDFGMEKWDEGTLLYNGKYYRYNDALQTYLFMGIDNDEPVANAKDFLSGGQADAIFLLVLDGKDREAKVVAINRNAMVPIDVYDRAGNFLGQSELPICLQHGYGDGMKLSCMMSVEAVDRLFRGIPVSGYLTLNIGGLPEVNDAIGGVELTPIQSIDYKDAGIKEGETLTLNGNQAYAYLRYRDVNEFGSANGRLERQKQYISAFVEKIIKEPSLANKLINAGSDYIVASIDLPKIADSAREMGFNENIYTLAGETIEEEGYESFYVDEQALIKLILEVFYKEIPR